MRTRLVVLSLLFPAIACGGVSASAACEAYAEAFCSKRFQCSAAQAQTRYTSEAGCRTAVSGELGCRALTANPCPNGQKLDASGLEQCVSDTKNQDCASFARSTPASCDGDLFVCR
jgi:hypothetical protein